MNNYIYLIQEREFIKTNEPIYKIGKSKQDAMKRMNQYPKGSICLLHINCDDCDKTEKILIKLFKNKYKHKSNIGNEYFEGNSNNMMEDIFTCIKNIDCSNIGNEYFEGNSNNMMEDIFTCIKNIDCNNINSINKLNKQINFNTMNTIFEINSNNVYKCVICNKEYNSYMGAWKHKNNKHNEIKAEKINNKQCKYCNKEFSDRRNRWRHENTICKPK